MSFRYVWIFCAVFVHLLSSRRRFSDLKKGQVDIIVGTHRVLSKDVTFKNLGLLIIDEEQRFGVVHKERSSSSRKTLMY